MENNEITILGLYVYDRIKEAGKVQNVLTQFGCNIKVRLGLHEVADNYCSESGLILLELTGDSMERKKMEESLCLINGVQLQKMTFTKV